MTQATPPLIIGWRESIGLPDLGIPQLMAKIDTGARTSALHAEGVTIVERNGAEYARFAIPHSALSKTIKCQAPIVDRRDIKNTSGQPEPRIVIRTLLVLAGRQWRIDLSLADREAMAYPLILGRTALRGHKLLINPGRSKMTDRKPKDMA